jgi:hypothetical protein
MKPFSPRVALTAALLLACAGCRSEKREQILFASVLRHEQLDFQSAMDDQKQALLDVGRWAGQVGFMGPTGNPVVQSRAYEDRITGVLRRVSTVRGALEGLQLRTAGTQTRREQLVTRLKQDEASLRRVRELLRTSEQEFPRMGAFNHPRSIDDLTTLIGTVESPSDIVGSALTDLRTAYALTDDDLANAGDIDATLRDALARRDSVKPGIKWSGNDWTVRLSPGMTEALAAAAPGFNLAPAASIDTGKVLAKLVELFPAADRPTACPSAVIGDFDGDGGTDAMVLVVRGDERKLLALMSDGMDYEARDVSQEALMNDGGGLSLARPGTAVPMDGYGPLRNPGVLVYGSIWGPDYVFVQNGRWTSIGSPGD